MKKIKVKNNANKIIEVTQIVWETLYKDRQGFSLYDEKEEKSKTVKKVEKKSTPTKKKVTKDGSKSK